MEQQNQKFNSMIVIVRKFANERGYFYGASSGVKFLDKANVAKLNELNAEKRISIRPVGAVIPQKEGVYELSYEEAWADTRAEFIAKNIIRCKGAQFKFRKDLPHFEEDNVTVAKSVKKESKKSDPDQAVEDQL